MDAEQSAVESFHKKYNFPINIPVECCDSYYLTRHANRLKAMSKEVLNFAEDSEFVGIPDTSLVRLHLILEEASELAEALSRGNRIMAADAIADLLYVVIGTAVTYNIPCADVFWEVHQSNMTKALRDEKDTRLRSKGSSYRAPAIKEVLEDHDQRTKNGIEL